MLRLWISQCQNRYDPSVDYHDPLEPFTVPKELNRRIIAAAIDIGLVTLCTFASLLGAFAVGIDPPWPGKWGLIALAVLSAPELLTGQTVGKLLAGLRVRSATGSRASIGQTILRGTVRLIPVALLVLSLVPSDSLTRMIVLFAAVTVGLCYFPACYFSLFRRGVTTFDLIAGTKAGTEK